MHSLNSDYANPFGFFDVWCVGFFYQNIHSLGSSEKTVFYKLSFEPEQIWKIKISS